MIINSQNIVPGVHGIYLNAGAPVDGTTFNGIAPKGALLVDTTNAKLYINTGTLATNAWTVVGSQS